MKARLTQEEREANRKASWAKWYAKTFAERAEAKAAYQREYRLKNKERLKAAKAEKYQRERERVIAKAAEWAKANRDKTRAAVRKWGKANRAKVNAAESARIKANPHVRNAKSAKHRACRLQATPAWANLFFIKEIYHLAVLRAKALGGKWHVDHIVPLRSKIVCGLHCEANLRVITASQNLSKSNAYWPDMP
jgi:hypothetical protein